MKVTIYQLYRYLHICIIESWSFRVLVIIGLCYTDKDCQHSTGHEYISCIAFFLYTSTFVVIFVLIPIATTIIHFY